MKHESDSNQTLTTLIAGAVIGAVAMYMLDPDKGRRRRAIARDKARSILADYADRARKSARDLTHRAQGVRAQTRRPFTREAIPDDLVLIERARSRMGRVVSHPHAVQIGANNGRLTLSGPILSDEVQPLLQAIRSVPGVSAVDDHLDVHDRSESIPSLQGGSSRLALRSEDMPENWTPALGVAAVVAGAVLAFYGARSGSARDDATTRR